MKGVLVRKVPFLFIPLPDNDPDATHELLKRGDEYVVLECNSGEVKSDG